MNTGWSWEYVRCHVDLPMLLALNAEWREHPPVHHLVASYLGYKPADQPQLGVVDEEVRSMLPVRTDAPKVSTAAWDQWVAERDAKQGKANG